MATHTTQPSYLSAAILAIVLVFVVNTIGGFLVMGLNGPAAVVIVAGIVATDVVVMFYCVNSLIRDWIIFAEQNDVTR